MQLYLKRGSHNSVLDLPPPHYPHNSRLHRKAFRFLIISIHRVQICPPPSPSYPVYGTTFSYTLHFTSLFFHPFFSNLCFPYLIVCTLCNQFASFRSTTFPRELFPPHHSPFLSTLHHNLSFIFH
uniref:Uncharacterized protein n=1 Tax=Cacopsylla melanoneura TaxID=428564 RepID=A0A8D8ZAW5_9HEMI